MKQTRLFSTALLIACLGAAPAMAAPDGQSIATQGLGGAPCSSCHGADGMGNAPAGFPRLAGLNRDYLTAQLQAFKAGTRNSPVMSPQAQSLDEAAIKAVAAYYAALPVGKSATSTAPAELLAKGRTLAEQGRWADTIPACVQCHGPHGQGIGASFPALAGQPAAYLSSQLTAWQQGTRSNDPNGLMAAVAKRLSDADIQAVAAWFAAQPAHSKSP